MSSSPVVTTEADAQPSATNTESATKPKLAKAKRGLYTPQPKQMSVIKRHLNGESDRKIAREENVDRKTVQRILSQEEVVKSKAEGQSRLMGLIPMAIDGYERLLGSKNEKIAFDTQTNILVFTGVADKRGLLGTIEDEKRRHFDTTMKTDLEFFAGPGPFRWPPPDPTEPETKSKRKKPARRETRKSVKDVDSVDDQAQPK